MNHVIDFAQIQAVKAETDPREYLAPDEYSLSFWQVVDWQAVALVLALFLSVALWDIAGLRGWLS